MSTTGLVFHHAALEHVCGHPDHPERPERISAIRSHLVRSGLDRRLEHHEPEPAERSLIELAHDPGLVDLLEVLDARGGGQIDLDTGMGPGSLEAALRGSQGTVDAADRVLNGTWDSAMVCMRPPGHHATPDRPMGFCLTNHVAIAARWAIRAGGVDRVAVVDWDAHHGNGTQDIFWTDPDVLYVSLHQFPWYPGSGDATERGGGGGAGYTLNVPLPAGAAEDAYMRALDEVIEPAIDEFAPGLVLVSAGYDGHHLDPLCMMRLTSGAFFRFTQRVSAWGPGPVCVLEGGYDLDALGWSCAATVSALTGSSEPVGVPEAEVSPIPGAPEAHDWVLRAASLRR
ncbi:MAG: histone deacetylase family protein [Actinomycetota bacterium]